MTQTIIIGYTKKSFQTIKKEFASSKDAQFIFCSRNLELIDLASSLFNFKATHLISSQKLHKEYLTDTETYCNTCNDFITTLFPNISPSITHWIYTIEGGHTTRKIYTSLKIIDEFLDLIDLFKPTKIIYEFDIYHQDDYIILKSICAYYKIPLIIKNQSFYKFFPDYYFRNVSSLQHSISKSFILPEWITNGIKNSSLIFSICFSSRINKKNSYLSNTKKNIIFLFNQFHTKHLKNLELHVNPFMKNDSFNPIVLTWQTKKVDNDIKAFCSSIISLKSFCSLKTIFTAWKKTKTNKKENHSKPIFLYRHIDFSSIVYHFLSVHIRTSIFENLLIHDALTNFVNRYNLDAFFLYGQKTQLSIIMMTIKKQSSKHVHLPIFSSTSVGISIDQDIANKNPFYNALQQEIDIKFVISLREKKSKKTVVTGFMRLDDLLHYKKTYSKETCQKMLRLHDQFTICLLPEIILGYESAQKKISFIQQMIDFFNQSPQLNLIIKPHPSDDIYYLKKILMKLNHPKNILLANQSSNPYMCIQAADIVIHQYSTLGCEALCFDKLVLCCSLYNIHLCKTIFQESMLYYESFIKLKTELEKFEQDRNYYLDIRKQTLIKSHDYLSKNFYPPDGLTPTDIIYRTTCKKLNTL